MARKNESEDLKLSSPDSASGKLQRICLELLREHEQQGEGRLANQQPLSRL